MYYNTLCSWRCLRERQRWFRWALHDDNVLKKKLLGLPHKRLDVSILGSEWAQVGDTRVESSLEKNGERLVWRFN